MNKEQKERFLEINDRHYYWIGWEDAVPEDLELEFFKDIASDFRGLLLDIYKSEGYTNE